MNRSMNAHAINIQLAQRFHALRRKYFAVRVLTATSIAISVLLGLWIVFAALDYVFEFPQAIRKSTLYAVVAIVAAAILIDGRWLLQRIRPRPFVAKLETMFDGFGQRLRTVLDAVAGRVEGPDAMLAALGSQTLGRWEMIGPNQIVPTKICGIVSVIALLLAGMVALFLSGRNDWRTAMLRSVGYDVAYTSMQVRPGNHRVLENTAMQVELELLGRTNRDVTLRYRHLPEASSDAVEAEINNSDWIETQLLATIENLPAQHKENVASEGSLTRTTTGERSAIFKSDLGKAKGEIEYQFLTSIGSSQTYRLSVQPLIVAKEISIAIKAPEYTVLQERLFRSTDVVALAGSTVSVRIESTHPLASTDIEFGPKSRDFSGHLLAQRETPTRWTFELPTDESLYWKFSGIGLDGTPMSDVTGRLRIRQDTAPTLVWRDPGDPFEAHALAELPMRLTVSDDYGIEQAGIAFQLGQEEFILTDWLASENENENDDGTDQKTPLTKLELERVLPLESFELTQRDYVSYYGFAIDNRAASPQRVETDIRYIDIRPLRQLFSLREEGQPGDGEGRKRFFATLEEIIRRERFLINRTRRRLPQSVASDLASQLGTVDLLVENQSELASIVRFFVLQLVEDGNDDVESLNQAETSMLQAADSLAAADFELAYIQENDAQRFLAEAKKILEVVFSNNLTLQQQNKFRRMANKLRQKMRLDRPKNLEEVLDSLQAIAGEQMRLSKDATQIASGDSDAETSAASEGETSAASEGETSAASEGETIGDSEAKTGDSKEDKVVEFDPIEKLVEQQSALQGRFADLRDELENSSPSSKLFSDRMNAASSQFDKLNEMLKQNEFNAAGADGAKQAELIGEVAIQLRSLMPIEPTSRISEIRNLATSLSAYEFDMVMTFQDPVAKGSPAADQPALSDGKLARRVNRRLETIQDVLQIPVEVGDVETSAVNDYLKQFIDEVNFESLLERTSEAFAELDQAIETAKSDTSAEPEKRAIFRAKEYIEAAQILSDLYQQLLTPRLDKLRELEQKAEGIVGAGTTGTGKQENENELAMDVAELRTELTEAGLEDLAKLLDEAMFNKGNSATDEADMRGGRGTNSKTSIPGNGKRFENRTQAKLVLTRLRKLIQELILLEMSPDRDTPVPLEYVQAVDQYFQRIAGVGSDEEVAE